MNDTITLTAPEPVVAVAPRDAAGLVPVDRTKRTELQTRVDGFVDKLAALDPRSPEFGVEVDKLVNLGQREIRDATSGSNHFLDKPIRNMDADAGVGAELLRLRRIVENLDPSRKGDLLAPRKLFGLIPFGNRLRDYFEQYSSAQTNIAAILKALAAGKEELVRDNIGIDTERRRMWDAMGRLEQMIVMAAMLDEAIERQAAGLDATDPAKARIVREGALFNVRQRHQDLLTQMAVTVQGYMALDMVKKNNVELAKGVERATTTTVAALRTAVTVAQALGAQRLVLRQIGEINATTASLIEGTADTMRTQSAAIQRQAASSTIPVETLQRAFANIYATMDEIDGFKLKALDGMRKTVDALSIETEKARARAGASMDERPALAAS